MTRPRFATPMLLVLLACEGEDSAGPEAVRSAHGATERTTNVAVSTSPPPQVPALSPSALVPTSTALAPGPPMVASAPTNPERITLLLGGDVSFGRSVGQRVLSDPAFDPFAGLSPWFESADLTVVNLESILSDQGGVTEHPYNDLVFSGPPSATKSLLHAGIDAVSAANNHAWDYGRKGLVESLGHLGNAGIAVLGASPERRRQYEPVVIERNGFRIGILAFTQVWNDGDLEEHAAKDFVAGTDYESMKRALRRLEGRADFVVVSLHASNEYVDQPRERARRFAKGLVVSGADLVFGHHPHVLQGLEWLDETPIVYSLGNLVFESRHPAVEGRHGAVALVELERRPSAIAITKLELCPVTLDAGVPSPGDPDALAARLSRLSKSLGGLRASPSERGCVHVEPSELPLPYKQRRGFLPNPDDPDDDGLPN